MIAPAYPDFRLVGMKLTAQAIVDGAPSAELAALLDGVRTVGAGGEPKFSPSVQQELARLVVGRAYAPVLFQLCHLIHVAALAPRQRVEMFFWGIPNARGSAYAGWVRARLAAGAKPPVPLVADANGVALDYSDGRFGIAYGQMPLLVAMMELLVSALGYPAVLERVELLLATNSRARTGEIANDLARALYAFLAPHLPTAHESRRFQRFVEYMLERGKRLRDDGDFSRDDIDDGAILDLWLTTDDPELRVYATVLRGFLRLADALDHAAINAGIARADRIGTEFELGEVDIDADAPPPPGAQDEDDPLAALEEPPASAVKALNLRERTELAPVIEAGALADRLALSLLRDRVFGALQARLTEALRRGGAGGARRLLDGNEAPDGYASWVERYAALDEHLSKVMLASLHLLARAGRLEAMHLLAACGQGVDLAAIGRALPADADAAAALRALADPTAAGPEIAALMLRARRAFQSLSRAGFEPDAANRREAVEGHAAAAAPLVALASRTGRFRAALSRQPAEAWHQRFADDRSLFATRFRALYSADERGIA